MARYVESNFDYRLAHVSIKQRHNKKGKKLKTAFIRPNVYIGRVMSVVCPTIAIL